MAKYEIMLVIDGTLSEKNIDNVLSECQKNLNGVKDFKETKIGLKKLAYQIKKISQGYYCVLNFSCDKPKIIKEFNRLALINKNILRFLIINLEKDYGYKASHNAKKVERSKLKAKIYEIRKKAFEEKMASRKAAEAVEANVSNKLIDENIKPENGGNK